MEKIALFYAPAKGSTEKVALQVQENIGKEKIDLVLIDEETDPEIIKPYSKIIFGISTVGRDSWNSKYKKIGWDFFLPKLEKISFNGKTVAIFGLGDHILYAENFVDAMGSLASTLIKAGADIVGQTSVEGYTYSNSEAIINNQFVGLPLDEENEPELTEKRINLWIKQISVQMGI
jgi:flavodoxin I